MKYLLKGPVLPACLIMALLAPCNAFSADLDDIYSPILKRGSFLIDTGVNWWLMEERGTHGAVGFHKFDATPYYLSMDNTLRFAPVTSLELRGSFTETFPVDYKRFTYNENADLVSIQEYTLDHFRKYSFGIRGRYGPFEAYTDIAGNRQKTRWDYAPNPHDSNIFTHIRSHYEDYDFGLRFLSGDEEKRALSDLSKLTRPLLDPSQFNIDIGATYRSGVLRRGMHYYYQGFHYYYDYSHNLSSHLIERFSFALGLAESLEIRAGLFYTTPLEYEYEYDQQNPNNSLYIRGTYRLKDNFYLPLEIRYRPRENAELSASSNMRVTNQRLIYWQKDINNSVKHFPSKSLIYYNVKPALTFTYLHDAGKDVLEDEFTELSKTLLRKRQWLFELAYETDISHLNKGPDNGRQNIIDPYNIFSYPLENFVTGSEYATLLVGSTTAFAAHVQPENYHLFSVGLSYGVTDNVNVRFGTGYRTGTSVYHFTLSDLAERCYKFYPYWFFDASCDWRITKSTMFSVNGHIVPWYITKMDRERHPETYKAGMTYYELSCDLRMLF